MRTAVLDHGYVELIETWGSDERIIEAARMSTDKGFLGWGPTRCPGPNCHPVEVLGDMNFCEHKPPCNNGELAGDEKLLRYLYTHKHMTPFEMAGMTIEVQAPIFVFREWHRHRTQSYNEMSARYTPLPDTTYRPTIERCSMSGTSKQSQALVNPSTGEKATTEQIMLSHADWLKSLDDLHEHAQRVYETGLLKGVPKEIARLAVTVSRYSKMRASANLRNWLGFLTLRMDPAAQWEIRQFANEVATLISHQFPRTYELFAGIP